MHLKFHVVARNYFATRPHLLLHSSRSTKSWKLWHVLGGTKMYIAGDR